VTVKFVPAAAEFNHNFKETGKTTHDSINTFRHIQSLNDAIKRGWPVGTSNTAVDVLAKL
jgi:hypothetical protein